MVQQGAIAAPLQVQNLPNAALLIAKLHSLDTEVIPCAVHLLCARSLLYAGVFLQSHHLLAFPSGGNTCRVPCNLPPQLIYTGKAPSEAATAEHGICLPVWGSAKEILVECSFVL